MTPELLVVGAGPAGVSAALWARALNLTAAQIEGGSRPGGQLHHVHFHPRELAGLDAGDGPALAAVYERQLAAAGHAVRYDAVAIALEPPRDGHTLPGVTLSTGERLTAAAVLIATGARRRHLGVPGERELEGRGVSYSATLDRDRFAGGRVLVVGGGDGAFENALLLAEVGCEVTVAVRGTARARPEFRQRLAAEPHAAVLEHARVGAILGEAGVRAVRLDVAGRGRELEVEGVVVKIGGLPNSEWCRPALAHDDEGFLRVDDRLATSAPRVWAAGDVTRPLLPSVPVAMGQGAHAVAAIRAALRAG